MGTDFIVMFMQNKIFHSQNGISISPELFVTTRSVATVNVQITLPGFDPAYLETLTVIDGSFTKLDLPANIRMEGISLASKAVYITSDADIMVYATNTEMYSSDAFLCLPTDALGTDHYAVTCDKNPAFGIAAIVDGTIVRIVLGSYTKDFTYNGVTYHAGDTLQITLNRFNTFQIAKDTGNLGDLTGTHISSNQFIAVFSGSRKSSVPKQGASQDHMVEQLTPVSTWGKVFATAAIPNRVSGDYFKIVASEDNTIVNMSTISTQHITTAGDFLYFLIASSTFCTISADKPIQVVLFVRSEVSASYPSDPAIMLIPPVKQYTDDYTFGTPMYPWVSVHNMHLTNTCCIFRLNMSLNVMIPDELMVF